MCIAIIALAAAGCTQPGTDSGAAAAQEAPQDVQVYAERLMAYEAAHGDRTPDAIKVGETETVGQRTVTVAEAMAKGEDGQETAAGTFAFDLKTGDVFRYDTGNGKLTLLFNVAAA